LKTRAIEFWTAAHDFNTSGYEIMTGGYAHNVLAGKIIFITFALHFKSMPANHSAY
jgi:hypothetical protein